MRRGPLVVVASSPSAATSAECHTATAPCRSLKNLDVTNTRTITLMLPSLGTPVGDAHGRPATRSHTARSRSGTPALPIQQIIAAVARSETDGVVAALRDAGFARDRIVVVIAENVPGLDDPIGGSGLRGLLTRLHLSIGDDLDEFEQARQELLYGHALILVQAVGDVETGPRARSSAPARRTYHALFRAMDDYNSRRGCLIAREYCSGASPMNSGVPTSELGWSGTYGAGE